MSRQPSTYVAPISPVTPVWAGNPNYRATQRQQLLPSAIEMNTPPQTVPRKLPAPSQQMPSMPSFTEAINATHLRPSGPLEADALNAAMANASPVAPLTVVDPNGMPVHPLVSPHDFVSPNRQMPVPRQSPLEGYPSMQASYQQYYPQQQPIGRRVPGMSLSNFPPGRVVKGTQRLSHESPKIPQLYPPQHPQSIAHSRRFLPNALQNPSFMMAPGVQQGMSMYPGAQMMASGMPNMPVGSYPSFMDDRRYRRLLGKEHYASYNHYILRHAAEEKSKVIWPPEVEMRFMEAVWLIPGDSCKIQMERRTRGRNELISDYLKFCLDESRSRKQVSSHLQVLKKLLKADKEFLDCVGPKKSENPRVKAIPGEKKEGSKKSIEMTATSFEQLIEKLREAKQGAPKPDFLRQAENNLELSKLGESDKIVRALEETINFKLKQQALQQTPTGGPQMVYLRPSIPMEPPQASIPPVVKPEVADDLPKSLAASPSIPSQPIGAARNSVDNSQTPVRKQSEPHILNEPPLRHPRPVHAQDMNLYNFEPVVPSASVPPNEALDMIKASPRQPLRQHRRHPSRHHRRTTSTSVDLSGDKVLPIQFVMGRVENNENIVYSRLLRATYESPMRPLQLRHLTPKFAELAKQDSENLLAGTQVVHANVALHIRSNPNLATQTIREQYSSDVQFVVTAEAAGSQHRYIAKTVVASRSTELLRCEMPCMYQRLAGRGLELDKELVNVPFLPDFWSDFLARLNNSEHDYVETALAALTLQQSIYRVSNDTEELCFVSLYQFSAAQDEFSARTRFRRVKGVPGPPSASNSSPSRASSSQNIPAIREPSTPTRSGGSAQRNLEQTPKATNTPNLLGIGTPGQAMGSLGALINCDSPSVFASPRRMATLDSIDLGGSPFTAAIGNETRNNSPRSAKFEIQRAMTAFEPSAWDEMHDWIYQ